MRKDEEQLIHEKIAVPDASPRVSRQRLLKLLVENVVCCNATIINGRAGTGKTTLAADFARYAGRQLPGTKWMRPIATCACSANTSPRLSACSGPR